MDVRAYIDIGESQAKGYSVGVRSGDKLAFACFDDLGVIGGPLTCPAVTTTGTWQNNPSCTSRVSFTFHKDYRRLTLFSPGLIDVKRTKFQNKIRIEK